MVRTTVTTLAALVGLCGFLACGSDGDPAPLTRLVIDTSDISRDEVVLRAPKTVVAGPAEIVLRNRGDTLHDAQLFRVDGDRDAGAVVGALETADSEPWPRWLHAAGGVAPVRPGRTAGVRQVLEPGTYFIADTQERPIPGGARLTNAVRGGIGRLEVTGEGGGSLPTTEATIDATEYRFDVKGIVPGRNRVTFRNTGSEFHQVVAFPIATGVSFDDGRASILSRRADTGWVPVDVPHERATTVLEGGGKQITDLTFEPGRYLLLCFVSDHSGGDPQWTLGMMSKVEVTAPAVTAR